MNMHDTQGLALLNTIETDKDSEFMLDTVQSETGQYVDSLVASIKRARRNRDRKAERAMLRELNMACVRASIFVEDDLFFDVFENTLRECEAEYATYPEHLRRAMVLPSSVSLKVA